MRIIAGAARGRRLASPRGAATRPLTDRVREALFSSLGSEVIGARVLDLYAGSGSVGLEALSRGAASAVFVERDRRALDALRRNIAAVGLGGEVVADDVDRYLAHHRTTADLAFVDPPYALPLASVLQVLDRLEPNLTDRATVVVHRRKGDEPPHEAGSLALVDRRRYGDAEVWRYHKGPS
jgi:16S rRNA (guanine966-N2)-methyltransferase